MKYLGKIGLAGLTSLLLCIPSSDVIEKNKLTFTIANWNLQIYGETKAKNEKLVEEYQKIIKKIDIVFIQEIREKNGIAFAKLCENLTEFICAASSRAGNTSSKEQYGIIHKKEIKITNLKDYNSEPFTSKFNRPPIKVSFQVGQYNFSAYNIHTDPDDVSKELGALEKIVVENEKGNTLVLGDLNADCKYFDNTKKPYFANWFWAIEDNLDTTVSKTNCAYDRIIVNLNMQKEFLETEVFTNGITPTLSDHYLVWAKFRAEEVK